VKAIWYRRPDPPIPHREIADPATQRMIAEECRSYIHDVWDCLDCLWVPGPPHVMQRAQTKAYQLQVAAALGFEIPPTLFTNSPEDFREFYRRHNGRIVSKLAGHALQHAFGTTFTRYTEMVSTRDLSYAATLRYCPAIFQAYVPKRLELRITVVGEEVFAAEIHSQHSHRTRIDWRRYDLHQTPHLPHELPDEVRAGCLQLVKKLGLCYGAIDMVLTPDGRYVFIEINPNGQFMWIEFLTGLPITGALCDLMTAGGQNSAPHRNRLNPICQTAL
jgi:glutathione synthase/RimK-type ligase-like ATP-grasp enzyme